MITSALLKNMSLTNLEFPLGNVDLVLILYLFSTAGTYLVLIYYLLSPILIIIQYLFNTFLYF